MHAFGLPGRLIISVRPRMTETARDSIARLVICMDAARMASAMPGTCLSATASVASGVTSRCEKPVPPVVKIKSGCLWSHNRMSSCSNLSRPSGSSSCSITVYPLSRRRCAIIGPLLSSRVPGGSRIAQCNHGRLKRKRLCPRNALHVIADMDGAAAQDTANTPSRGMMQSPTR